MSNIREISGQLDGRERKFAIVASRFNGRLVRELVEGAVDCLLRHDVDPGRVELVWVPGAWEIPQALDALARRGGVDGLVALGVVIRGETPHFEYVCTQCSAGIARVATEHRLAIGFGILTCDSTAQAEERSGGKVGNKGWEAALAALEMVDLLHQLGG